MLTMFTFRTASIGSATAFCMAGIAYYSHTLVPLDHWIFSFFQKDRPFVHEATVFTHLGRFPILTAILAVPTTYISYKRRSAFPIVFFSATAATSTLVSHVLKLLAERPRPPYEFAIAPIEPTWSFPSGHTMNAALITGIFAVIIGSKYTYWLALAFSLLMGFSRIYLGHHWFSDVFGSFAISLCLLFPITFWFFRFQKNRWEPHHSPTNQV